MKKLFLLLLIAATFIVVSQDLDPDESEQTFNDHESCAEKCKHLNKHAQIAADKKHCRDVTAGGSSVFKKYRCMTDYEHRYWKDHNALGI